MVWTCKTKIVFTFVTGVLLGVLLLAAVGYFITQNQKITYSDLDEKLKETIIVSQLDGILEKVEVYKLVNGRYPGSLNELQKGLFMASLYIDPESKGADCAYEYYYVLDEEVGRYTLLSIGRDKTLFTEDDIWPSLAKNESSALGLSTESRRGFSYPELKCYEWDDDA